MGSATIQGQLWGAAAYDWAELQEPMALPLWQAMLDAAQVGPGTRLLDAGCGAGGASVLAASRGAQVNGLDASAALLTIARQRVPDGDFRLGDLAALPYADGIFDAVIAADVIAYVANPSAALRELKRVSVPEGRIVVATCDTSLDLLQRILATVTAILPAELSALWSPPMASFAAAGALAALLTAAGLAVLDIDAVACPCDYPDQETAWQALAATGPLQAIRRIVGAAPLKDALLRAVAPYETAAGRIRLVSQYRYVVATPNGERPRTTAPLRRGHGRDERGS